MIKIHYREKACGKMFCYRLGLYLLGVCLSVILCSCGQQTKIQNTDATEQEYADEEYTYTEEHIEEPENMAEEIAEQEPEQQESEEENQYAVYERFMAGDEPLYIREDQWSYVNDTVDSGAMLNADASYTLDEICNKINRTDNSGMAVNEMGQLSYAYIDCGADGTYSQLYQKKTEDWGYNADFFLINIMNRIYIMRWQSQSICL